MDAVWAAWQGAGERLVAATGAEDAHLLARCRRGDRQAQEVLVREHQQMVFRIAHHVLGNQEDALDAAQEALVTMLRALPSYRGQALFTTWLYRLTTNVCLMQRRRRQVRTRLLTDQAAADGVADGPNPEDAALSQEVQAAVRQHLARLPAALRAVVVLREIEGLAYQEVAQVVGIPLGTVQSRLSRARELLREALLADERIPKTRR